MATVATMAIRMQARVDEANRMLALTSSTLGDVERHTEQANRQMQVMQGTMSDNSSQNILIRAMNSVSNAVSASTKRVIELGTAARSVSNDIMFLTGRVLDLSTGLPVSRALSTVLGSVAGGFKSILLFSIAVGASTLVVAWFKGVSISAAFTSVMIHRLSLAMSTLWAIALKFVWIPAIFAFAMGAESVNRELAGLTGTLTPLQKAFSTFTDAFKAWSVTIGSGVITLAASGLQLIFDSLLAANVIFESLNAATGGWLTSVLKVTAAVMTLTAAWILMRMVMFRVSVLMKMIESIGMFKPVIEGIRKMTAAIWSACVAQSAHNGLTMQGIWAAAKMAFAIIVVKAYAAALWMANAAQFALNALTTYWMGLTIVGLAAIGVAMAAYTAYLNSSTNAAQQHSTALGQMESGYNKVTSAVAAFTKEQQKSIAEMDRLLQHQKQIQDVLLMPQEKLQNRLNENNSLLTLKDRAKQELDNYIENTRTPLIRERNRISEIVSNFPISHTYFRAGAHDMLEEKKMYLDNLNTQIENTNQPLKDLENKFENASNATQLLVNDLNKMEIGKYVNETYGKMLDVDPAKEYRDLISQAQADVKNEIITRKQYNEIVGNANEAINRLTEEQRKSLPLYSIHQQLLSNSISAEQRYTETMNQLNQLMTSRDFNVTDEQQKRIMDQANSALANGLGITSILQEMESPIDRLNTVFDSLTTYAEQLNKDEAWLVEAQRIAMERFERENRAGISRRENIAAVRGTTAAYEAERKTTDAQQKQNEILKKIEKTGDSGNAIARSQKASLDRIGASLASIDTKIQNQKTYDA